MKKLKYSLAALALIALAACNKTEMPGFLSDPDAVRIEAAVGTLTKSNPLGSTIDEQMKFNDGDRISVTNAGKTVVYKLNGGSWTPENSSEYLKWDKNDLVFTVKYPADYTTLPYDQSDKEKLASADYMYVNHTEENGIPDKRILSTSLFRRNVLVRIKIAGYLDQYKEGETYIKNLRFYNVQFPLIQDKDGKYWENYEMGTVGCTYIAILEPHSGAADEYFVEMILHKANQVEGPIRVKGIPELEAGHAYTFNLYVGKNTVKIGSVTVNEWTSGDPIPDGETDPVDTWDGQTATAFATQDAEGNDLGKTENNPILINNCAQLAYLAQQVNEGCTYENTYFKLTDDLNLAGKKWTPIGEMSGCFSGHFDGNNHDILRLNVDGSPYYAGLFGRISGGSVKNVNIRSGSVRTDNDAHDSAAGGIAGHIYDGGRIENCTASVNVSGKSNVGGIVGNVGYDNADKSTVSGCSANTSVKGTEHKFSNCTMKGSVTVARNSCGGLVGYLNDNSKGTFENCQFKGSIKKDGDSVSNTGIAIGADNSNGNVTFTYCVCTIDNQTYMALNGWEAGNKENADYIGIEVTTK